MTFILKAIIIGRVYKMEEQATRTVFHLDDTTGKIQVAYYKRTDGQMSSILNNLDYRFVMRVSC